MLSNDQGNLILSFNFNKVQFRVKIKSKIWELFSIVEEYMQIQIIISTLIRFEELNKKSERHKILGLINCSI